MEIVKKLTEVPLFTGLHPDHIRHISAMVIFRQFDPGQMIFSEGDAGNGFHVLMLGRVKIFKISPEGKEQILHIFGPGEPFGEVAVFMGLPFPAFAVALDITETLFFPRTDFIRQIRQNPEVAMGMLAVLAQRLHHFTVLVDDLSLKEVPARLARYLLHLDQKKLPSQRLQLDITKGHLAAILGTIPETLSRAFRKMIDHHMIEMNGSEIIIRNYDALETLSWSGKF